ncbi:MAG: hypothetical protein GXY86_07235 [Firmicutes bacterium]|nr:hypothetical protein [Bacillota bacterium]
MSFNLSIESDNSIRLGPGVVESVCFVTCPPDDFNNEDVTFTLEIIGKILTDENNVYTNAIRELAMWSLIPPIKAGCYRKVTLETIIGGKIARKVFFLVDL